MNQNSNQNYNYDFKTALQLHQEQSPIVVPSILYDEDYDLTSDNSLRTREKILEDYIPLVSGTYYGEQFTKMLNIYHSD